MNPTCSVFVLQNPMNISCGWSLYYRGSCGWSLYSLQQFLGRSEGFETPRLVAKTTFSVILLLTV